MGSDESGDRVFQQSVNQNSTSDHFYGGSNNWEEIVSLTQSGAFGNSNMVHHQNEFVNPNSSVLLQNQTMVSSSHLVHFPSDSCLLDNETNIGSQNFSEMNSCRNFAESNEVLGHSPYAKRKRQVAASPKNAEEEQKKDQDDEDKQKFEQDVRIGPKSRSKQLVNECKDNLVDLEPSKENYIHMRAKRGQATNSHSLAERMRRERISERMRLLQELVPGCDKITGKAMMLDEIINYVQSLQQQVEFLSMKLATVNPELNVDLDRILSKDILHGGIAPSLSSSHNFSGYPQGTTPPFNPLLSQHIWNNELQGILQMGFDPDPSNSSLGQNGLSRMDL